MMNSTPNDSLPTPPSSPHSHSPAKTPNLNAVSQQNNDDDDNNNDNENNNATMPIFPLPTYPPRAPSTQTNLLHALPDLSTSHHHHHHHPLHSLNTIITNPHPPLYPVHHTHSHDHHHHHHIAPPFMASLYSPRFPHPTINPFMPTIDPKLSSSITMPPIQNKRKEEEEEDDEEEDEDEETEDEDEEEDDDEEDDDEEEEEEEEEEGEDEKTLTGIWVVYYTWDMRRDLDMSNPRYEMELLQHKGGNIEGKCVEDSGSFAWNFLLTGKLEQNGIFEYTMHGEDEEVHGRATFDGNDIIKDGMWYRDRLCLKKGGSLVAARKGTQLPLSLMQKTHNKKMTKRKRDHAAIQIVNEPPFKRYKTRGAITTIDGRIVPPEPPPIKYKIKNKKIEREDMAVPNEYKECDLTGAWSLYFDNSVSHDNDNNVVNKDINDNNNVFETPDLYNYYDSDDEPINNDTLFLSHNTETHELSGFVCSPLKCHVTGNVGANGIDVRLIMIWSPNKDLGGQFAGYVTVINGEYDCDRGLNCEYCSFHCTSYFHTMLYRRFETKYVVGSGNKMAAFESFVADAVKETKYNNSYYVSIVERWFHQNENSVIPGQIHSNKNNYSNQCIWRRRLLPSTTFNHIHQRMSFRKKHRDVYFDNSYKQEIKRLLHLTEFEIRDDRISLNQSPFFLGDLVQLFIAFNTVLSHPLSYYESKYCINHDSDLENDDLAYFGKGKWIDGIIISIYEAKVLVRYYYENALYQEWIDCDINYKRVTIQPIIRLRKSLKFSFHLKHIISELNISATTKWRLNLNKSCLCFAQDENGEWAKAIIKRRFGHKVYIHWVHFDAKYDQYLSIHSQRIQPLNADDICNSFRTNLNFKNVTRIKPNKLEKNQTIKPNSDEEIIDQNPKTTATSNIFGSLLLHLQPKSL